MSTKTKDLTPHAGTKGSDANPGTEGLPFKTLAHARDMIRDLKNKSVFPEGGVVVMVRAGVYSFADGAFTLEQQDSGLPGSPVV